MTRTPWQQLLGRNHDDGANEYGPQTQEVWAAFAALRESKWLANVGQPVDGDIALVRSWDEAIAMFEDLDGAKYGPNGHLIEPVVRVRKIMPSPREFAWWQSARHNAVDYAAYSVPRWMVAKTIEKAERSYEEAVEEYIYEFISWLLAEIISGPSAGSTYFHEQLEWFHAGHFPCGWEGEWPAGRMRVF